MLWPHRANINVLIHHPFTKARLNNLTLLSTLKVKYSFSKTWQCHCELSFLSSMYVCMYSIDWGGGEAIQRLGSQPHARGNHSCFLYIYTAISLVLLTCAEEKTTLINFESDIDNRAKSALESQGIKLQHAFFIILRGLSRPW